jgi:Flp pilus assembly protein TadG
MVMLFACLEYGRMFWTWQALQLASDQTARCVAIASSACATPSAFAIATASGLGASGLLASAVLIDNKPPTITNAVACSPPAGNSQVRVRLSLSFTSPAVTLIPSLNQMLTTTSCYPLTGN